MSSSAQYFAAVTSPQPNDVLFGRGYQSREHPGTKVFHELCRLNREEYRSTNRQETKNIVAYRILNAVTAMDPPARFLEPVSVEDAKKQGFVVTKGAKGENTDGPLPLWKELGRDTVLRKIKQSLRDAGSRKAKVDVSMNDFTKKLEKFFRCVQVSLLQWMFVLTTMEETLLPRWKDL